MPIESDPAFLGAVYNVNRLAPFRTVTQFLRKTGGSVSVSKRRLGGGERTSKLNLRMRTGECSYCRGPTLAMLMLEAKLRRDDTGFEELSRRWFAFLAERASQPSHLPSPSSANLPGEYLDCLPHNLIQTDAGFEFIDQEWSILSDVPLVVILLRGFYYLLSCSPEIQKCFGNYQLRRIIDRCVFGASGQAVKNWAWEEFIRIESTVSSEIAGVNDEARLRAEIYLRPRIQSALMGKMKRVLQKAGLTQIKGSNRRTLAVKT